MIRFVKTRSRCAQMQENPLINKIDDLLPQTQCGLCNFPGCKPYAEAIAEGRADINQCPPGGEEGIQKLADLLGVPFKPYPVGVTPKPKAVAFIDENSCIGCTLCIAACPVDAIAGAAKQMHTIIASACTGCELCLPPCPVDCISMLPLSLEKHGKASADAARERFEFRNARLERDQQQQTAKLAQREMAVLQRSQP